MPPIEVPEEDADDGIDFEEPAAGSLGFHSIAIDPPKPSSQPALFAFSGQLAKPVEAPGPDSFTTPPARAASFLSMSSQAGRVQTVQL